MAVLSSPPLRSFPRPLSLLPPRRRTARRVPVCLALPGGGGREEAETAKGLLSFVTDNPSSRDAIQLPNSPAQDGNLGQMISQIENKGQEFGYFIRAGEFKWFVRETGSPLASKGTVFFLHGAPTQSYSYKNVLEQMAKSGYHCFAPDWIGFGFSDSPQPGYEFAYSEEAYHKEFDRMLDELEIGSPFYLVTQGFLVGSYGLTWALKNPKRVLKLVVLNGPLTPLASLPSIFSQMRFPILGEFVCQNAMLSERFVEGGSPYSLEIDDADVYRLPYLDSSNPGFALLEVARKASFKDLISCIQEGFSSPSWNVPTLVAWGESDKYLPKSEAEDFVKLNSDVISARVIEGAGHMPHEDWPEKIVDALLKFF